MASLNQLSSLLSHCLALINEFIILFLFYARQKNGVNQNHKAEWNAKSKGKMPVFQTKKALAVELYQMVEDKDRIVTYSNKNIIIVNRHQDYF